MEEAPRGVCWFAEKEIIMKEKCRLCLEYSERQTMVSIGEETLRSVLGSVFSFPITSEVSLPEGVCESCVKCVQDFHTFGATVLENQGTLRREAESLKQEAMEQVKVEVVLDEQRSDDDDDDDDDDGDNDPCWIVEKSPERESREDVCKKTTHRRKRKQTFTAKNTDDQLAEQKLKYEQDNKDILEFFQMDCELCTAKEKSFLGLSAHYRKQHNVRGYIRCCNRMFTSRWKLLEHIAIHKGSKGIRCEICNKTYNSKYYLSVHTTKIHGKEEDRPYKCDKCHQSYSKEYQLKAHQSNHVQVQCTICSKMLSSSLALRAHVSHMHGSDGTKICDTCGQEFRTKLAMERHIKQHLGIDASEKVQCKVCDKWLNSKPILKIHTRIMHEEAGQVFRCDICQHACPNSRALQNHKQRVHVEEKFECELCGKRFKRKIYLREHRASHTGVPLYACDVCDATFNSNANMYAHRKNKHPVEWEARKKVQL